MFVKIFAFLQYFVPQHLLSRIIGWFGASELNWIKKPMISWFIWQYNVDLTDAIIQDNEGFKSFNDFFTRALQPGKRPFSQTQSHLISPADGTISEQGDIAFGQLIQAKGKPFSLCQLLGGDIERTKKFIGGEFTTIYLSPKDYHRVHMPLSGTLTEMVHIPGKLFSVNPGTTNNIEGLFAKNERVVCYFETDYGPMAVIMVGAMIVASIETVWAGQVTPKTQNIQRWNYQDIAENPIHLEKGDELGHFKMGSTVIVLMAKNSVKWTSYSTGNQIKVGDTLGDTQNSKPQPNAQNFEDGFPNLTMTPDKPSTIH